jgi:epoxyqueuosine reductase QueG
MMAFCRRGFDTTLRFDASPADAARCGDCQACVTACPVGALVRKTV